jgi:hypothetical protein
LDGLEPCKLLIFMEFVRRKNFAVDEGVRRGVAVRCAMIGVRIQVGDRREP